MPLPDDKFTTFDMQLKWTLDKQQFSAAIENSKVGKCIKGEISNDNNANMKWRLAIRIQQRRFVG